MKFELIALHELLSYTEDKKKCCFNLVFVLPSNLIFSQLETWICI